MLDKTWSQWTAADPHNPGRVSQYTRVEGASHPDTIRLIEFWQTCEARGGFLVGQDIPSRALAGLLHSLMVNEPLEEGADYRIRLAGSALRRRYGHEITGHRLSELFSADAFAPHPAITRESLTTGRPGILDVREEEHGQLRHHREVVVLPVWAPERTARWVLAGIFYFD